MELNNVFASQPIARLPVTTKRNDMTEEWPIDYEAMNKRLDSQARTIAAIGAQWEGLAMATNKYRAHAVTTKDGRFDSKLELKRWGELNLLARAKEISNLKRQVPFTLHALGGGLIGKYIADFTYFDGNGQLVVEDAKGVKTPMYRWKKKHVAAEYGIEIQEIAAKKKTRR